MRNTAYAVLRVKAIDDEQRTITGTATSPRTDREGDIVEPSGVTFRNPIPLLLHHDPKSPVGTVRLQTPTADGVEFTASLPVIQEPGALKDRVDLAWQSIKAKLIRGVSIGFRAVSDAMDYMRDTGGIRYRKIEILELSLVAVPANQDCTIATIKAYDVDRPAAPGAAGGGVHSAGAAATTQRVQIMTISERLTAARAALRTKMARLEELVTKGDGEVMSDAERQEQTTLNGEIATLTADVESLDRLEKAAALQARPIVTPASVVTPGAAAGAVTVTPPALPPGIEFARYVICRMAQFIAGGSVTALEIARQRYPDQPRIQHLIKAAVAPMTSADGANTGGTELVYAQNLVSEFVEFLRPQTIVGKFGTNGIPSLRRIPFNVRIVGQTSGGAGYWVGQAKPKPLKKYDFAATNLAWAVVAAISVISDQLARFSTPSAEALVRDALAGSLIERMDRDFVDPFKAAAANVSPASITNGIAPLTSSGTDAAAVRYDIQQLLALFVAANIDPTNGVFIMPNSIALALSLMRNALGQREFPDITMRGGTLEGFPVIASQYCSSLGSPASDLLIFCNASDIYLSDDGQMSVDVSREASLEMEDDPENQVGTVVSMFQNNLMALRAERYINWARRRTAAVQFLEGVAYNSGSPA